MIRAACATALIVLAVAPLGRAQAPSRPMAIPVAEQTTQAAIEVMPSVGEGKKTKSVFAEDGPVDTTWAAQMESFWHAVVRLPVAALLSAILAFRPRRRGTPKRQGPVIQTQIVLALVGAMVMMVVGASLARAFGIVGAAGLIRYRAKIDDPKDASVMLSCLAIGLASGVGLFYLAAAATFFIVGVLWTLEWREPWPMKVFDLKVSAKGAAALKPQVEALLRKHRMKFELRGVTEEDLSYAVEVPQGSKRTDRASEAITKLGGPETVSVAWAEKKAAK